MLSPFNSAGVAGLAKVPTVFPDVDPLVASGVVPGSLFPGLTATTSSITVPLSALSDYGLTQDDIDPDAGDARALIHAIVWRAFDWLADLDAAPQATVMTLRPSYQSFGDFAGSQSRQYTLTAYIDDVTRRIVDEPT